jgi:arylsulfatase A-like enzyme
MVSSFPHRHGAYHVLEGFREWHDPGEHGHERADVVVEYAEAFLDEHADEDDWFLHLNFWDPHTNYDTPESYGNQFDDVPAPEFPDAETISSQYDSYGPHSAHEPHSWGEGSPLDRLPEEIDSRSSFKQWIDWYDTGIHYMDHHLGRLFDRLREEGIFEETLVVITADHGENQGELNVYGDHQTADEMTCNVPLIVRGPAVATGVDDGLYYNLDVAPTLIDVLDGDVPERWDGRSFEATLTDGVDRGREFLVFSQGAWACQRGVRWDRWLLLRTYHDGVKDFEPVELYDLEADPHETTDLSETHPEVVERGLAKLERWLAARLNESATGQAGGNPGTPKGLEDPLWSVIEDGGPVHATRDHDLEEYVARLRDTGRETHADALAQQYLS